MVKTRTKSGENGDFFYPIPQKTDNCFHHLLLFPELRTPVTPDGGDGKLFHGAMSGNISDWMSAGSGRTWRRRKQNQENYLCGNSSGAEKGGSGTFASRPGMLNQIFEHLS